MSNIKTTIKKGERWKILTLSSGIALCRAVTLSPILGNQCQECFKVVTKTVLEFGENPKEMIFITFLQGWE